MTKSCNEKTYTIQLEMSEEAFQHIKEGFGIRKMVGQRGVLDTFARLIIKSIEEGEETVEITMNEECD